MKRFTQHFNIKAKNIEFVDVYVSKKDTKLFIDPFLVKKYNKTWSGSISDCWGSLLNAIGAKRDKEANNILDNFCEGNMKNINLGYSDNKKVAKGTGLVLSEEIKNLISTIGVKKLRQLRDLEKALLFIGGIGDDRISDITANMIATHLLSFTEQTCKRYKLPTKKFFIEIWDIKSHGWKQRESFLPYYKDEPIILTPKKIVSINQNVSRNSFYLQVIVPHYQKVEYKKGNVKLVPVRDKKGKIIRNDKLPPDKKEIKGKYKGTSSKVIRFMEDNINLLHDWSPKEIKRRKKL